MFRHRPQRVLPDPVHRSSVSIADEPRGHAVRVKSDGAQVAPATTLPYFHRQRWLGAPSAHQAALRRPAFALVETTARVDHHAPWECFAKRRAS